MNQFAEKENLYISITPIRDESTKRMLAEDVRDLTLTFYSEELLNETTTGNVTVPDDSNSDSFSISSIQVLLQNLIVIVSIIYLF